MLFNMKSMITISLIEAFDRSYADEVIENLTEIKNNFQKICKYINDYRSNAEELATGINEFNDYYTLMMGKNTNLNDIERMSVEHRNSFDSLNTSHILTTNGIFVNDKRTSITKIANGMKPANLYSNMTLLKEGPNTYKLTYIHVDGELSYVKFNLYDSIDDKDTLSACPNFMVGDLYCELLESKKDYRYKICHIYDIFVKKKLRHFGMGTLLIDLVTELLRDYIIVADSGASMTEYPELDKQYPDSNELNNRCGEIAESLRPFYESVGFKDVNGYIGGYESKTAYMFMNEKGKDMLSYMEERHNKMNTGDDDND